ncbi:hypothetical protein ABZY42_12250 [Streptomyces sp. NPDC006622]|uniref:hypothetical protein n=1 Tax=Streptomyces sp. NPDC006622 TaxID=3155459 RepID=UPI0033A05547
MGWNLDVVRLAFGDALRDRWLLMIDDDSAIAGGGEPTEPAKPRSPYGERPVARARRTKAQDLLERLFAEGRVRITDPDEDEVAEWRRVVNYAKRHGLEPVGKRIEKVPYSGPGLELFLAEGLHPNARSQGPKAAGGLVAVPVRLGHLHPVVAALRNDESRLLMPSALRRRSLLLLQGLAAEAVRRGYEVRKAGSSFHPREGGVDVSVEEALGVVLGEIEARAVADARRRQDEQQARAAREVRRQAAMDVAREQAAREQLAQVLHEEAGRWHGTAVLSAYCMALERRIDELDGVADEPTLDSARRWLHWARGYVSSIDPLSRLPKMPDTRGPTPEELKRHESGRWK